MSLTRLTRLSSRSLFPCSHTPAFRLPTLAYSTASVKADTALLSKLRKETGLPFSLCSESLVKNANDYPKAIEWARNQAKQLGLKKVEKLKDRVAAEGLVAICAHRTQAALVELNCETDFVSRNQAFQEVAQKIAAAALHTHNVSVAKSLNHPTADEPANLPATGSEAAPAKRAESSQDGSVTGVTLPTVLASQIPDVGKSAQELIAEVTGKLGEKIELRRVSVIDAERVAVRSSHRVGDSKERAQLVGSGVIGVYTHGGHNPHYGRMGGLVSLIPNPPFSASTSEEVIQAVSALANRIAQQVVGLNPVCVSKNQGAGAGASAGSGVTEVPDDQILLEQAYLQDTKKKVKEVLKAEGKKHGLQLSVGSFVRFSAGEGIETRYPA